MKENKKSYYCVNCGYEIEVASYINEEAMELNLCEDCFYDEHCFCEFCGKTIHIEEAEVNESNGEICCRNCLENNGDIFYCCFKGSVDKGYY